MSLIDRHKKPGGFKKLVNSLELTTPDKRGQILSLLRQEDSVFVGNVEESIFNFEEFQAQDIDSPYTLRALKQLGYKQHSLKKKTND